MRFLSLISILFSILFFLHCNSSGLKSNHSKRETVIIKNGKQEWMKCALGFTGKNCENGELKMHDHESAVLACSGSILAGKKWRLPTKDELAGLVDKSKGEPSIDLDKFPNTKPRGFWTATSVDQRPTSAWFVLFKNGMVNTNPKTLKLAVRCIAK